MKLFVLLVAITWSSAAKLDKTYLPPRSAQTSGGSGNFLQTPVSGSLEYQGQNGNGFGQNGNAYSQNGNGVSQSGNAYSQNGNGIPQNGNAYSQNGNGVPQNGNAYSQNGNSYSQNGNGVPQNGNAYSQNGNSYSQNGNSFSQGGNNEYNNVNGFDSFENRPERAQAAFERNAAILRQDNQNDGETYAYGYETENGISAEESGVATNGVEAQGGFSYTGDDGQIYSIRYTADQNGFVPQGDHLPTPPPVPEEILKALEQNARDEAAGIYDDGLYNEAKYNGGDEYEYVNDANSNNNYNANSNNNYNAYNNQNEYQGNDDSVVTNSALIRNSPPAYRNQGVSGASDQDVSNERYNPATSGQGVFNRGASSQGGLNQGPSNQGDVNKAYLPPFADQRSSGPAFGSRTRPQSFSTRNGYNY